MHGQVHLAGQQRLTQRADEDTGAADLGQLRPADVAQRRDPDDLDAAAGPLGDHVSDLAGLRDGHRASAAAEPEQAEPERGLFHPRTLLRPCSRGLPLTGAPPARWRHG
jgi:hypothetical protein